jgi:hypothetical protein
MTGPFGDHQLKIPYEPVADLLAKYARRDPNKTAIVDLETSTSIAARLSAPLSTSRLI